MAEVNKLEQLKKFLGFAKNKDLAVYNELNEISNELKDINKTFGGISIKEFEVIKGEKGDSPSEEELVSIITPLIPDPIPGATGSPGRDGEKPVAGIDYPLPEPGYTPVKGVDYFDGNKGDRGEKGEKGDAGKDGLDGSPDTPEEVRDKLGSLSGDQRLDAKHIKNLPKQKPVVGGGAGYKWNIGKSELSGTTITVSATAPVNPVAGDLWVDVT